MTASKHRAPRWGVWLFGLWIPTVIWSVLSTLIMALGVFPLFDLTPALVVALALLTRRWDGVATRWFAAASVLAGVMILQWIPWYWWLFAQRMPDTTMLSVLSTAYGVELLVLLVLGVAASVVSIRGIRRERAVVPLNGVGVDAEDLDSQSAELAATP